MMQPTSCSVGISSSYAQASSAPASSNDNSSVHSAHSHPLNDHETDEEMFVDEPESSPPSKNARSPSTTTDTSTHQSTSSQTAAAVASSFLSSADIQTFRALDIEYERALEEREVAYAARYNSVRQSACFAVSFMAIYMTLGTLYFMRQANWTLEESLFFGIYTITTVGCKYLAEEIFVV